MNSTRLKALAKLGLLLGVPLAVVLGLFSYGVKVGVEHRAGILSFERDWLGMNVEVPGEESTPDAKEPGEAPTKAPALDTKKPPDAKEPPPTKAPTKEPSKVPGEVPGADTTGDPTPPEPAPRLEGPAASPFSLARLAAVPASVEPQLRANTIVRVKVLVDRAIILNGGDWISDVQDTVRWTSEVLHAQVGVQLELVGVVAWSANTLDLSPAQLKEDLESRARDGADLVVGFTNRSLRLAPQGAPPVAPADALRSVAVAYSETGSPAPRVHGLLLAIGEVFGARAIVSSSDPEALAGSWMGVEALRPDRALYLDPANRLRIIGNKNLEFETPDDGEPAALADGPDELDGEEPADDGI